LNCILDLGETNSFVVLY